MLCRWTWYEPFDSSSPNNCVLFESCSLDSEMCDNCYTGKNCRTPDDDNVGDEADVVIGGVDDNGANLTSVEVVAAAASDHLSSAGSVAIPDIPSRMAYRGRAAANIAGTIFACGGTDTCGRATNRCMNLQKSAAKPLAWSDDMPQPKRARYLVLNQSSIINQSINTIIREL